ncbi:MAG: hypothetical protein QXY39_08190 [Thermofilaceae archaeon]
MAEGYAEWLADYVWNSYVKQFGHPPRRITRLELGHLTRFFVEECRRRDIDPEAVDFYGEIFEDANYHELQRKIVEVLNLIKPLLKEPIEIGLDEALSRVEELGFRVREEDLRKIENVKALEDKIERLRRNVEKLRRELVLEKARREAAAKELERIRAAPPAQPPPPAPRELSEKEVEELRKLWESEIKRALGMFPRDAARRFDAELLPIIKTMPFEKARETVIREAGWYAPPAAPPVAAPPAPLRPPKAPPEAPAAVRPVPPEKVEPPGAPMEPMPWPRRLASSEIERFWKAFRYRLWRLGLDPEEYMSHFIRFRDAWFSNWFAVLRSFEDMIKDIEAGLAPRQYPRPPIWRELPRDAVLHLLATKVYKSIDQLIEALNLHGVFVSPEEVREIVKKEWAKVPRDTWLAVTPKEYLVEVLGLKPEDLPG